MTHIMRIDEMSEYKINFRNLFTRMAFDAIHNKCPISFPEFEEILEEGAYGVRMSEDPGEMECLSDEWKNYIKEFEDEARKDYERDIKNGDTDVTFDEYFENYDTGIDAVGYYYLEIQEKENDTDYTIVALAEITSDDNLIVRKTIFTQDVRFNINNQKKFVYVVYKAAEELAKEIYR